MKKKAQVYLLDTEQIKEGSIVSLNENTYQRNHKDGYTNDIIQNKRELSIARDIKNKFYGHGFTPKYLYFTSDEDKIKEGELVYQTVSKIVLNCPFDSDPKEDHRFRKIVATTNPELYKPSMIRRVDGCPFYLQSNGLYQATDEHGTETLEVSNINTIGKIGDDFVEAYISSTSTSKPRRSAQREYMRSIISAQS